MSIKENINTDLKKALLAKDKETVSILRGLKSSMLNAEIATGKRDEGLNDTEITSLLQKEVKSRKESAELYEKGGDQERANKELDEIKVIEEYLPKQMSDDELEAVVDEVLGGMSDVTPQMMGQVIGAVKQKVGASADGGRIAATVKGKIQK